MSAKYNTQEVNGGANFKRVTGKRSWCLKELMSMVSTIYSVNVKVLCNRPMAFFVLLKGIFLFWFYIYFEVRNKSRFPF